MFFFQRTVFSITLFQSASTHLMQAGLLMSNTLDILMMQEKEGQLLYITCLNSLLSLFLGMSKNMTLLVLFPLLCSVCVLTVTYNPMSSFTSPPSSAAKVCMIQNSFKPGFVANGDFVIGGIFPFHYNQEMPDLNSTYRPPPVKCNG